MNVRKVLKILGTITFVIVIQLIIYRIGDLVADNPLELEPLFEDKIPFVKEFIYFYISWYLMLYFVPLIIGIYDKEKYYKYITVSLIGLLITCLIFAILPTHMYRVDAIAGTDYTTKLVNYVYSISTMTKCIPSLHCYFSFVFMLTIYKSSKIPKGYKTFIYFDSIMIIISTLLVKQHLIYDIVSAFIVAIISIYIAKILKLDKYLTKVLAI